jgi:TRAP-type C4-dicarboxylate transport system permease small subunit
VSDLLVALLATAVYGLIAWVNWQAALSRLSVGSFVDVLGYRLPIWPSYFLAPAGFLLAALVTLLRAVQAGRRAVAP